MSGRACKKQLNEANHQQDGPLSDVVTNRGREVAHTLGAEYWETSSLTGIELGAFEP